MASVRITDKEVAALIRCANMGLTQAQAAELTLLSPTVVSRAATKYCIRFHTYRENEDGRNARTAKVSAKAKATSSLMIEDSRKRSRLNLKMQLEEILALATMIERKLEESGQSNK